MKKVIKPVKALLLASLAIGLVSGLASCKREGCTDETALNYDEKAKKDDGSCEYAETPIIIEKTDTNVAGEITTSVTWDSSHVWIMDAKVIVKSGATLTIEPGTIIKAEEGQEAAAVALIVEQGAKIHAEGTAEKPIIFTSVNDDIKPGQKAGSNLKNNDNGLWGGVIILGKAPSSTEKGDKTGKIEGIPADASYSTYGGDDAADNSGVLSYVSIRHCGTLIGEANEINGLTLGGVGAGTKINNIEIYATVDDGVEFFGGTVNAENILVYYQGDDGLDIDQNYSGTIKNFAVISGTGIGTDKGLEIDGPEGTTYTTGLFTLENGLLKSTDGAASDFKSKAQGNVKNVTFEYPSAKNTVKLRASFDMAADCAGKSDAAKYVIDGKLTFSAVKHGGVETYINADETGEAETCADALDAAAGAAETKIGAAGAGGSVDLTMWSWGAAGFRGQL